MNDEKFISGGTCNETPILIVHVSDSSGINTSGLGIGHDLVAILDFGQVKPVNKISLGTLQDTGSWIVFPQYVQYWSSNDGTNYKLLATVNTKVDIKDLNIQTQEFTAPLNLKTRYIKVVAKQYGPLPEWHESKGQPSYIFADEITVE